MQIKAAQPRLVNTVAGPNHHDKGGPLVTATQTISLSEPCSNRSMVLCTLARQKATKAIKERFRAQGVRLSELSALKKFAPTCHASVPKPEVNITY
jgi:hypothetical protein